MDFNRIPHRILKALELPSRRNPERESVQDKKRNKDKAPKLTLRGETERVLKGQLPPSAAFLRSMLETVQTAASNFGGLTKYSEEIPYYNFSQTTRILDSITLMLPKRIESIVRPINDPQQLHDLRIVTTYIRGGLKNLLERKPSAFRVDSENSNLKYDIQDHGGVFVVKASKKDKNFAFTPTGEYPNLNGSIDPIRRSFNVSKKALESQVVNSTIDYLEDLEAVLEAKELELRLTNQRQVPDYSETARELSRADAEAAQLVKNILIAEKPNSRARHKDSESYVSLFERLLKRVNSLTSKPELVLSSVINRLKNFIRNEKVKGDGNQEQLKIAKQTALYELGQLKTLRTSGANNDFAREVSRRFSVAAAA